MDFKKMLTSKGAMVALVAVLGVAGLNTQPVQKTVVEMCGNYTAAVAEEATEEVTE